jgi:hypothetical protein
MSASKLFITATTMVYTMLSQKKNGPMLKTPNPTNPHSRPPKTPTAVRTPFPNPQIPYYPNLPNERAHVLRPCAALDPCRALICIHICACASSPCRRARFRYFGKVPNVKRGEQLPRESRPQPCGIKSTDTVLDAATFSNSHPSVKGKWGHENLYLFLESAPKAPERGVNHI